MLIEIILILLGFFLLVKGADFLVDGASDIAKKLHVPEIIIGLTIVSIGTSLPELVVSAGAALKNLNDVAIGNVVGSNIANLFLILGACAMIRPLTYLRQTKLFENPINFIATLSFFIVANGLFEKNMITRVEGFILLTGAFLFIAYNIFMAMNVKKYAKDAEVEVTRKEEKNINIYKAIGLVIGGIILLKFGGDFVVDNAVPLAKRFGLSEKLISVTVIALSTSLPELITSITATVKGEIDMAIGNVLGSQIFNIFLIIGSSALLSPIAYSLSYNKELILLMIGSFIVCINPFIGTKNAITKRTGILFLGIYLAYMTYTVISII